MHYNDSRMISEDFEIGDYFAHIADDGTSQSISEHLLGVAQLACGFASSFCAGELAYTIGLVHDIGKYSKGFQARIRGVNISVDHSTAGAQYLNSFINGGALSRIGAYCVLGHHGGLPDGGSSSDVAATQTLCGRLKKTVKDYSVFGRELGISSIPPPQFVPTEESRGFSLAFFTRMLFSCLVDADWLDTEGFMSGGSIQRGHFKELSELLNNLEEHVKQYADPIREIDKKRTELLGDCIASANNEPGLFTLTAPTGSGKTVSSAMFALQHAVRNEQQRIIYVVPYNTIIEQNAKVFERIFGEDNVIQHHSGIDYDNNENSPEYRKLLATENWDAPIIVTSSVRFFESLFNSKTSSCRKLHNIVNSVVIFDEAQMIPLPYLLPCIAAMKELLLHYKCTIVLATATQPNLNDYFGVLSQPIREISRDPIGMCQFFNRVTFQLREDPIEEDTLSHELDTYDQVLCIVNTRLKAQSLVSRLGEDSFHLSTTMFPVHRADVLEEIRSRLKTGKRCRVVSTSLVEAGVDIDFPVLYREMSGLDSIIQAAGRCNREGKRSYKESRVIVFTFGDTPRIITQNVAAFKYALSRHKDISSLDTIKTYFDQIRYLIGKERLDKKTVIEQLNQGFPSLLWPFREIASQFKIIEDDSIPIIVLSDTRAEVLAQRLRTGERSRTLLRSLQQYSVSLYKSDIQRLEEYGAIGIIDEAILVLSGHHYDDRFGVPLSPHGGIGVFG